jgi:hypothetical protein
LRVGVHLFERPADEVIWFTSDEMKAFQLDAARTIYNYESQLLLNETGRAVEKHKLHLDSSRVLFTHPALQIIDNDSPLCLPAPTSPSQNMDHRDNLVKAVAEREIRRILIVDPHDLCLQLWKKPLVFCFLIVSLFRLHRLANGRCNSLSKISSISLLSWSD